ncbi:MAG: DUF3159 domain-containing protein [Actinomycetota bacterium]|nr:DUF3159 domain-containing protein [Actinomycetota bacterium]
MTMFVLDAPVEGCRPPEISRLSALVTVIRTAGPHLIEATIIPAALFYLFLVRFGLDAAYMVALGWSYGAVCVRKLCHRGIPPLLILGVIGITVRTLVAVVSGSSFVYFLQPVLGTVTMGLVFCASVALGRPLVGKLAREFWPMTPEVAARPAVLALFRRLTLVWAAVHFATAATTLTLLLWLPMTTFVALKQVTGLVITGIGVAATISMSLVTAKREGLACSRPGRRARVAEPALVLHGRLTLDDVGVVPSLAVAASS